MQIFLLKVKDEHCSISKILINNKTYFLNQEESDLKTIENFFPLIYDNNEISLYFETTDDYFYSKDCIVYKIVGDKEDSYFLNKTFKE
jgi:hypothetical protein